MNNYFYFCCVVEETIYYSEIFNKHPSPRGSHSRLCRVRKVVYCKKDI